MNRRGFTLIEIMIVVIIIAALAAMVTPYLMDIPESAKAKIAAGDIQGITIALKLYRLDNGSYPKDIDALMSGSAGRREPYLERKPEDPWGRKYRYKCPGTRSPLGYDLYSVGPDGVDSNGDGDDVPNWEKAK